MSKHQNINDGILKDFFLNKKTCTNLVTGEAEMMTTIGAFNISNKILLIAFIIHWPVGQPTFVII
jgi:hypothetical protein